MRSSNTLLRMAAGCGLCALAALRAFKPNILLMDNTFFTVVGAGLVLIVVPLEQMTSFKAGGIEVVLQSVEVRGAIAGLNLGISDSAFRAELAGLEDELRASRGARILWVDDRPQQVLAERRLMRALGIEIVSAISTERARAILDADNDFDLMITDVQRHGETHKLTGGEEIHEGVNYVVWLRQSAEDPVTSKIPVVFYAAYESERLLRFTRRARELQPGADACNTVEDLIFKVVRRLAEIRARPLAVPGRKRGTSARPAA